MSKELQIHIGDSLDEVGRRFVDAWQRAERGELTGANAERHAGFENVEVIDLGVDVSADAFVNALPPIVDRNTDAAAAGDAAPPSPASGTLDSRAVDRFAARLPPGA